MPEPTDEPGSHTAVASYVASMSADMAAMARRSGLDTLGYLLEMVHLEAVGTARDGRGSDGRRG